MKDLLEEFWYLMRTNRFCQIMVGVVILLVVLTFLTTISGCGPRFEWAQTLGVKSYKVTNKAADTERLMSKHIKKLSSQDRKIVKRETRILKKFLSFVDGFNTRAEIGKEDIQEAVVQYVKAEPSYTIIFHIYSTPDNWKNLPLEVQDKFLALHIEVSDFDVVVVSRYKEYRDAVEFQEKFKLFTKALSGFIEVVGVLL